MQYIWTILALAGISMCASCEPSPPPPQQQQTSQPDTIDWNQVSLGDLRSDGFPLLQKMLRHADHWYHGSEPAIAFEISANGTVTDSLGRSIQATLVRAL